MFLIKLILDWDWGGLIEEQPRYPKDINTENIQWPEGVGPGALITKAHDLYWVDKIAYMAVSQCDTEIDRM